MFKNKAYIKKNVPINKLINNIIMIIHLNYKYHHRPKSLRLRLKIWYDFLSKAS